MTEQPEHDDVAETTIPDETPAARFSRIATPRFHKVIKYMRLLQNTAGVGYESTPEQQAKLIVTLQTELDALAAAFEKQHKTDDLPTL